MVTIRIEMQVDFGLYLSLSAVLLLYPSGLVASLEFLCTVLMIRPDRGYIMSISILESQRNSYYTGKTFNANVQSSHFKSLLNYIIG